MTSKTATRDRVLQVAWDLARDSSLDAVTLGAIAKASGVSRQTLYLHFGNRTGLLAAMASAHDHRAGFIERSAELLAAPDPVEGLAEYMRVWCDYILLIAPVARQLEAGALLGGEAAMAWRDRMGDLRRAIRILVGRLGNRGLLAEGIDRDWAADVIWSTCHYSNWRNLVEECGWTNEAFADHCVATAMRVVAADVLELDR